MNYYPRRYTELTQRIPSGSFERGTWQAEVAPNHRDALGRIFVGPSRDESAKEYATLQARVAEVETRKQLISAAAGDIALCESLHA